jgi:putative transposase
MPTLSKLRQEDSRYSAKRTIALIEQCLLMLNVLKVRIYPNQEQQIALAKNFGCCRFVWNYYLHKTEAQYKETGKALSYCDMAKDLTQLKKAADYSWLKEATAAALQQSLKI